MKKIKFLIYLLVLSSCNQYLGTVDPDYTPTNELTEIFSDLDKNNFRSEVEFGKIIFPKAVNPSLDINTLEIEKIINEASEKNLVILTSEKDYFRIKKYSFKEIKYIKVKLKINDQDRFLEKIDNSI